MGVELSPAGFAVAVLAAGCIGVVGAMAGVGGGFLLVPVLLYLFPDWAPASITSVSLTAVLMNALLSARVYARQGLLDRRTALVLASTAVPAAVGGAAVTVHAPREAFELAFGVLMLVVAGLFAWRALSEVADAVLKSGTANRDFSDNTGHHYRYLVNERLAATVSPIAGFTSAFFGIGGGVLQMPILVLGLRVPVRVAVATAHSVLVATTATAMVVLAVAGHLLDAWPLALAAGAASMTGGFMGTRLAALVSPRTVLWLLTAALVAAAARQLLA
ncbi:MAG: sulfite exporter TauE/SafE family protein [Chloroflexota bacterium]